MNRAAIARPCRLPSVVSDLVSKGRFRWNTDENCAREHFLAKGRRLPSWPHGHSIADRMSQRELRRLSPPAKRLTPCASADAFVRAWERLNTIGDPPRGRGARQCSDLTAMTSMSTTTVPTAPASPRSDVTPVPTSRTDAAPAPDSRPRAVPSSRTSAGEVPDVTHGTFKDAAATLERSGYYVGVIEKRFAPSLPPETVIEQTPPAGTALPPGSKISIVVAVNGAPLSRKNVEPAQEKPPAVGRPVEKPVAVPPAAQLTKIPAVVRSSEKQAIATLEKLGFLPGRIEHRFYPNLPPGTVMEQHPAAGTTAVRGASVDLVIASSTP
jgi:hypothetical protein